MTLFCENSTKERWLVPVTAKRLWGSFSSCSCPSLWEISMSAASFTQTERFPDTSRLTRTTITWAYPSTFCVFCQAAQHSGLRQELIYLTHPSEEHVLSHTSRTELLSAHSLCSGSWKHHSHSTRNSLYSPCWPWWGWRLSTWTPRRNNHSLFFTLLYLRSTSVPNDR